MSPVRKYFQNILVSSFSILISASNQERSDRALSDETLLGREEREAGKRRKGEARKKSKKRGQRKLKRKKGGKKLKRKKGRKIEKKCGRQTGKTLVNDINIQYHILQNFLE